MFPSKFVDMVLQTEPETEVHALLHPLLALSSEHPPYVLIQS